MSTYFLHTEKLNPFLDKLTAGRRMVMVFLGDSNTNNTNFTAGAKQYPELLHSKIKDHYNTQRLLMVNAGVSGDTIIDGLVRFTHDVGRFSPDLVVLAMGTNDSGPLSDVRFMDGMSQCIDRIEELGAIPLVRTPTPIVEYKPAPYHLYKNDVKLKAKVMAIRELVNRREIPMIDIYQMWHDAGEKETLDCSSLFCDEVHLNAAGHVRMFEDMLPLFGVDANEPEPVMEEEEVFEIVGERGREGREGSDGVME